jgi:hypothetical protein
VVHRACPIAVSMPPLRSMPCSCTRPAAASGASANATDQNTDPFPAPLDPATRVCGPILSRHGCPSSRRPIVTADRSASACPTSAGNGVRSSSPMVKVNLTAQSPAGSTRSRDAR